MTNVRAFAVFVTDKLGDAHTNYAEIILLKYNFFKTLYYIEINSHKIENMKYGQVYISMKYFIHLFLFLIFFSCKKHTTTKYNLDFEQLTVDKSFAKDWFQYPDYPISIDKNAFSGEYSGVITSNRGRQGRLAYVLPAIYDGDTIQLEGFIKTENVSPGFAGLFLSIKGSKGEYSNLSMGFEDMQNQEVAGTKDWKKYKISLPLPKEADYIILGGILSGKGKAWFDNFKVLIDGKDVQNLKDNGKEFFEADLDKEFELSSKINLDRIDQIEINNLFILGKIWGFLKYYHPSIGNGEVNWDYELFRVIPIFMEAKNSEKLNETIVNWIKNYKIKEVCKTCKKTSSNAVLKPDLDWIKNNNFTPEIINFLYYVYENRHQGNNYYFNVAPNVGNPLFTHENSYDLIPSSDDGYRLLSLFRYWNAIEYFFPYKQLIGKDWDKILSEHIPIFAEVKDKSEYDMALTKLLTEIHDTHAQLYGTIKKELFQAPIKVKFVEDKLIVTSYADLEKGKSTGLKIGDLITKINNIQIEEIVDSLSKFYPSSNEASLMRDIAADVLKFDSSNVNIDYISNFKPKNTDIALYNEEAFSKTTPNEYEKKSYRFLKDSIGYITLENIKKEEIENIKKEFSEAKGIIIDIRNYPNTFVPFLLGSFFVLEPTPFVKFIKVNENNYGEFNFTESLMINPTGFTFRRKLIVLVNEYSQSQSEYTAMAFKAGINTTIIGSTTAGADGNVSHLNLPSGYFTRISGVGIYYPNGKETQRIGIIPDIRIEPTIEGIKLGKDELLEKAIEIITKQ